MATFVQRYQKGIDSVQQLVGVVEKRLPAHASNSAATSNDNLAITKIQHEIVVLKDGQPPVNGTDGRH